MTDYIVSNRTTETDLVGSKDHYFILKDVTVNVADGYAFLGDAAFYSNLFRVQGTVETSGLDNAFLIRGVHTRVAISSMGKVMSENTAVELSGSHSSVINRGTIEAASVGIKIDDVVAFIKNSGTITSDDTGISVSGRGGEIENYGLITADTGIHQTAGVGEITSTFNVGTVTGQSFSFTGSVADDTLLNRGTLTGDVFLYFGGDTFRNDGGSLEGDVFGGRGRDTFDLATGTVSGTVSGGRGNDTYIVGNADPNLHEMSHGGHDKVVSTASYALGTNMEILKLSGADSIDGTGNAAKNKIYGNDVENVLFGKAGNDWVCGRGGEDILFGGRGNDRLKGGADSDTFVFASHGGHDKIKDYEVGLDKVDLSNWHDIANFHDMMKHHAEMSGNNLVIQADGDRLTLVHTAAADLHASDFTF